MLQFLADTARDLSEPGKPNREYIRGQVNLIMDALGLSGDYTMYIRLTAYVGHETEVI
jgi:hypothetical protein